MARGSTCSNLNYAIIHTEIDRNTSQTTRENEEKNSSGTVKIAAPVPVSGTVDKDTPPRCSRVSLLSLFCISLLCLQ